MGKITQFDEPDGMLARAKKAARKSWGTEHKSTPDGDAKLARKLSTLGGSHNAALRQAVVTFDLTASRAFWAEFSKHYQGVEMYSESTMHTLKKRPLTADNFIYGLVADETLEHLNQMIADGVNIGEIKYYLPEGFLQTRAIMMSYPAMQTMYMLRIKHKLLEWREFLIELSALVSDRELMTCLAPDK